MCQDKLCSAGKRTGAVSPWCVPVSTAPQHVAVGMLYHSGGGWEAQAMTHTPVTTTEVTGGTALWLQTVSGRSTSRLCTLLECMVVSSPVAMLHREGKRSGHAKCVRIVLPTRDWQEEREWEWREAMAKHPCPPGWRSPNGACGAPRMSGHPEDFRGGGRPLHEVGWLAYGQGCHLCDKARLVYCQG